MPKPVQLSPYTYYKSVATFTMITIIGIPFGKMHFRLAKLALSPFGKELG